MVSAAIGMTACTVYLCAADDSVVAAASVPVASALDPGLPCIILHDVDRGSPCRMAAAAEKEPSRRGDIHVSVDHPDPDRLLGFLAGLCRQRRIPPERFFAHRQVEAGCSCGASIRPESLVGGVR